jgi:transcription elongation factor Elf1
MLSVIASPADRKRLDLNTQPNLFRTFVCDRCAHESVHVIVRSYPKQIKCARCGHTLASLPATPRPLR